MPVHPPKELVSPVPFKLATEKRGEIYHEKVRGGEGYQGVPMRFLMGSALFQVEAKIAEELRSEEEQRQFHAAPLPSAEPMVGRKLPRACMASLQRLPFPFSSLLAVFSFAGRIRAPTLRCLVSGPAINSRCPTAPSGL